MSEQQLGDPADLLGPIQRVCVHIDIPEILPGISSARVQFHTVPVGSGTGGPETTELVMPFQVLLSLAQSLPQLLQDMHAMGASKQIFEPGKPN